MTKHGVTRRLEPMLLACCALALTAACGGDGDSDTAANTMPDSAIEVQPGGEVATVYAPDLGIDLNAMSRIDGGVYIRDLEVGQGDTATAGDRVRVDYTGWFPNGVQFDASAGTPIVFTLGVGDVIAGWDQGITGMQTGGRRILVIPPASAYGDRGRPGVIPSNATLVFDVRLVEVMPDTTATQPDTGSIHD